MLEASQIRQVVMRGVHGYMSSSVELRPGLSIVHGKNGSGKTTLLHIIANLIEGDLSRFLHLLFKEITVTSFS